MYGITDFACDALERLNLVRYVLWIHPYTLRHENGMRRSFDGRMGRQIVDKETSSWCGCDLAEFLRHSSLYKYRLIEVQDDAFTVIMSRTWSFRLAELLACVTKRDI